MSWGGQQPFQGQQPGGYGAPQAQGYDYQAPPPQQAGYRPPPQQAGPGAPPPQQAGYGAPQQAGYGAPPQQQAGYRPPPPQQAGYGAPPQQQAGYRPPPAQQAGYGAPPQQQAGYRPPPPQQAGYGAPPPQGQYRPPGASAGGYAAPAPPPAGISQELWGWFQSVDTDRSGKITARELQQALHNGNWTPFNPETCRLMIGMFDRDRSGTIDIQEFSALWKYIQDWKSCFDRFDTDRSGNISANELLGAFKAFGYNLSMGFVSLCMRSYDRRGLGSINFDDFIQCCVMLKALTDKFREKDTNQSGVVKIHYEDFLKMVLDNSIVL